MAQAKFEIVFHGIIYPETKAVDSFAASIHANGNRNGKTTYEKSPLSLTAATLKEWGISDDIINSEKIDVQIRCGEKIIWNKTYTKTVGGYFDMFAPHSWKYVIGTRKMTDPYWEIGWKAYNYLNQEWNVYVNGQKANTKVHNPMLTDGYTMMYNDGEGLYWRSKKTTKINKFSQKAVLNKDRQGDIRVVPENPDNFYKF